jgi:hypothetical protein
MGLSRQFAQRHFSTFHGFTLSAEGGIAQTRASVFTEIPTVGWGAPRTAVTESVATAIATWACTTVTGSAVAASIATVSAARSFCFLLTRAVVTPHSHHRFGGLGRRNRRSGLNRHICWSRGIGIRLFSRRSIGAGIGLGGRLCQIRG